MNLPYNVVRRLLWVVCIIYFVVVFFAAQYVAGRSLSGARTVVTNSFLANHQLQPTDLAPGDQAQLVGHYLRDNISKGGTITANMVTSNPLYTRLPNTLAAIITVPRQRIARLGIDAKSEVQICRGEDVLVEKAEVAAVECGETDCSVVLSLPQMKGQEVDPKILSTAAITLLKQRCGGA